MSNEKEIRAVEDLSGYEKRHYFDALKKTIENKTLTDNKIIGDKKVPNNLPPLPTPDNNKKG